MVSMKQKPSGGIETKMESNELEGDEMNIASEIMEAIKKDDKQMLWGALEAAFQMMDAEPHMEGPHGE